MQFEGRIHLFGDHIDTDMVIPSSYTGTTSLETIAGGCFALVRPGFRAAVAVGDILVAGENFGCGSSREHAPIAIKACGISCVVATSFSRLFYRSAINIGLPAVICPEAAAHAAEGLRGEVDLVRGTWRAGGETFRFAPFPAEVRAIIEAGGLVPLMKARAARMKPGAGTGEIPIHAKAAPRARAVWPIHSET